MDYENKWITDERISCRIQFCFVEIGTHPKQPSLLYLA
jgi:hypothetical protein